jgi:hypothetical protein
MKKIVHHKKPKNTGFYSCDYHKVRAYPKGESDETNA